VDAHVDGGWFLRKEGERAFEISKERGVEDAVERVDAAAGSGGIAGVGFDKDGGAVTAQEIREKFSGMFTRN